MTKKITCRECGAIYNAGVLDKIHENGYGVCKACAKRIKDEEEGDNNMKTLKDLAEMVQEKETELAPGSETAILGAFVREFDYVSSIIGEDSDLDPDMDVTEAYETFAEAYRRMEEFESQGIDYDWDMLW